MKCRKSVSVLVLHAVYHMIIKWQCNLIALVENDKQKEKKLFSF